jgi:hypothetical protein
VSGVQVSDPQGGSCVAAYGKNAILMFLKDFEAAPNDTDIEIRTGHIRIDGPCLVVVGMCGKNTVFSPRAADLLASMMEDAVRQSPNDPAADTLSNIIMGLRQGAVMARRHDGVGNG